MKATLIVIQNEADYTEAKAQVEALMGSEDPKDRARMLAQARLVEAYERTQWPRRPAALESLLTYLMDQHISLSRSVVIKLYICHPSFPLCRQYVNPDRSIIVPSPLMRSATTS
jgi:HTH-type transcriptional regulator / antitoxin HigA